MLIEPVPLALALTVINSKPADLSFAEYINLVLARVQHANSSSDNAVSSDFHEVYHQKAQESQQDLRTLREQIQVLEKENAALKSALVRDPSRVQQLLDETLNGSQLPQQVSASSKHPYDFLICEISLFQVALNDGSKENGSRVAWHASQLAEAIVQALRQIDERSQQPHNSALNHDRPTVIKACVCGGIVLINGLATQSTNEDITKQVVAIIISLFQRLSDLVIPQSDQQEVATAVVYAGNSTKNDGEDNEPQEMKRTSTIDVLDCMILQLKSTSPVHTILFDNFAATIVTRLGEELYKAVFGHERKATLIDEIRAASSVSLDKVQMLQSELSKKDNHLFRLFDMVVTAAAEFVKPHSNTISGRDDALSTYERARHALQKSLIQAVFGHEMKSMIDGSIVATPSMQDLTMLIPEERLTRAEWLQHKIWRTIGWETLHDIL